MSFARLLLRSIAHYRRTGVLVAGGIAVATAVIVGSLVIGDSIEGSIRHTALARLGVIFDAITAPGFFRAELADDAELWGATATLIRLNGSAQPQMGGSTIADVAVVGADESFFRLYPGAQAHTIPPRSAIINEALASDAGVAPGDPLLVTVSRPGEAAAGTLFARRERDETLATLRVTVQEVLPDLGLGGFRLDPSTAMPRNVIVDRDWLSQQIGETRRANTIVLGPLPHPERGYAAPERLQRTDVFGPTPLNAQPQQIKSAMTLEDYGLYTRDSGEWLSLFSDAVVLSERQVEAAEAATDRDTRPTSVYLADTIAAANDPSREIAYAVVTNVAGDLREEDQFTLNAWAAEDLGAEIGERFTLTWRASTPSGYEDRSAELTLIGIEEMEGLAADPGLVPDFEGITDAAHIDDWDPPFPVDLSLVTDRDDEYWERYRAAPKAFVSSSLLQRMWQGNGDEGPWITSVRVEQADADEFEQALLAELEPEDAAFRFVPVREQALVASRGTSDFGQLFLGMSIFLVAAGAGLAAMLMRLSAERRASQAGIMMATGFGASQAGRTIAAEGLVWSLIGVAAGTPLGILYARGIVGTLATRWQGALGDAPVLDVYVQPLSVAIGAVASLLVGVIATRWGARVLTGRPLLELLRGWQASAAEPLSRRPWTAVATPLLLIGAAAIFALSFTDMLAAQAAFFAIGGLLLLASLTAAHLLLTRGLQRGNPSRSLGALALRNASSARGRSLLVIGLIAAATFVIVTVAANARDFSRIDPRDRTSGTGGFTHIATTSVPLSFDPSSEEGRENLGFLPEEEEALRGAAIIALSRSPGEDISCLNIARPTHPILLGITDEMIARGGFPIDAPGREDGNPWTLLREETADGEVAAFGDVASLVWQLQSGVGETLDLGEDLPTLRFVGALQGSIFQSELLVHADQLRAAYPEVSGPSYLLIEVPEGREEQVAEALRSALGEMGLQVRTTAEVLNRYITVQNTYLTMFLALGGLGLLLGTIGLVAVILRGAFERRSEFALMLATGFTAANLSLLLVVENVGLFVGGMVAGTATALIAVSPHLASAQADVNWSALAVVLGAILLVGIAACIAGARAAVQGELIEALRTE